MKILLGAVQVLAGLLHVVKFLLLRWREQRTNLCHGTVDDGLRFLHRILMNRDDLWLGLIDDRLHLGLLISSEVQSLGQVFKRKSMTVPSAATAMAWFCLREGKSAERDCRYSGECE